MISPFFPRRGGSAIAGLEGDEEPSGERVLRLIQDPFSDAEFAEN